MAKPFSLDIYFGTEGKGAFVQYRGQQGIISLRLKTRSNHGSLAAPKVTYVWDEVIGGKATGSYGLTQEAGKLSGIWYKRSKDGKQFQLEQIIAPGDEARIDKYLLHDVLISFRHTSDNLLVFSYSDGSTKTSQLPGFDHPDPRRLGTIADYNFDGFDDVAFSIPDEGMGVYRTFSIYLYNPKSKRFQLLAEPNAPQGKCSGLCDVTLDKKNKLLMSSCRGGATWWTDVYRYSNSSKLMWVKSSKQQ
ncbi:XAC2610-related protein [Pedobacter sp. WC2501]|uniref:XAC2610-related protein n=1 Tax=Pedobacter sp. WC2501 TaxID=3461400 RepID=UPI004045E059